VIEKRPPQLADMAFYKSLPRMPIQVDFDMFPDLLKFDVYGLCGLLPVTSQIAELFPDRTFGVQPTQEVVDYYCSKNTQFLMVSVVANCCIFKQENGIIRGHPYSVSLFPASVRNKLDYVSPHFAASFDLENMSTRNLLYLDYDPFSGEWGLFGPYSILAGENGINLCFSDMIGFVLGVYFLADSFQPDDVIMVDLADAPSVIQKKYRTFRIKRYYKSFTNLQPRRIWGLESPIELFLMQAMIDYGLSPVPQHLIYGDGSTYPCFHDMFLDESFRNDKTLITQADFYFPDRRLAVFCDSSKHHRSKKARAKDESITESLKELGFNTLRIPGPVIVDDLSHALQLVVDKLNQLTSG
jgi:hypothetical protein